jgi:hypothetical protein
MVDSGFKNIMNDITNTVKLPLRLTINAVSNYYNLKPEIKFQLEREKTDNIILKLLLKKERTATNNLRLKLEKQKNINDSLKLEIKNKNKCPICLENNLSVCCIPCGHTYCYMCIYSTQKCFICRNNIKTKNKLYL